MTSASGRSAKNRRIITGKTWSADVTTGPLICLIETGRACVNSSPWRLLPRVLAYGVTAERSH